MRRAVFKNNFKNLDRGTDSVILLALIKGSNLRLEICVCSVVSTVETSGTTWKWRDFYCIFCYAIIVSFFYHCCVYLYAYAGLPIIQLLKWIHMKLKKEENDSGYK